MSSANRHVSGAIVLVAAVAVCAMLLFVGPVIAEAMLGMVGAPSDPLIDTIFTLVLYGMLLAAALIGAKLCKVDALRLGNRAGISAATGFAIGAVGVSLAAAYAWIAGTASELPAQTAIGLLAWGTFLVIIQAGSEEVYFRGWLQPFLAERWGTAVAIILSAIAFSLLHVIGGARSPVTILNLFLGGVLFGLLAARTGGIAAPVAGHIAWNWVEQMVLGLVPNPGLGSFGSVLDLELAGATLWGGSEEGLNASLAMTFALILFVVPLLLMSIPAAATARDRSGPAPA